ncbi:MAG: alpha/beta fold hydrolase, partial [Candidatus Sericytochromatia bacterium]
MKSDEKSILNIKSNNEIKKLVTEEGKIAYQDFGGNGEAVICIPSLGDTMNEYRFLAEKLKEEGFRVITMDLRGHGNSDTTFTSYNAMDIANDISLLIKELNLEEVNLIGCSISGGSIAAVSTLTPNKVKKLVMISPFSRDVEGGDFIA